MRDKVLSTKFVNKVIYIYFSDFISLSVVLEFYCFVHALWYAWAFSSRLGLIAHARKCYHGPVVTKKNT